MGETKHIWKCNVNLCNQLSHLFRIEEARHENMVAEKTYADIVRGNLDVSLTDHSKPYNDNPNPVFYF